MDTLKVGDYARHKIIYSKIEDCLNIKYVYCIVREITDKYILAEECKTHVYSTSQDHNMNISYTWASTTLTGKHHKFYFDEYNEFKKCQGIDKRILIPLNHELDGIGHFERFPIVPIKPFEGHSWEL